ncbi:MAG: phosphatidic acid phosphatase [Chloroflexi bacterium]|nr:phosphatidic acid phosphatase [Chloroflexota bacterium]
MQIETRKRIANLTSNILNPFLVSLAIIWLLSFASAPSALDALKWILIAVALSVLPVFLVILYLVRTGRLDTILTNARGQRTQIFLLSGACAVAGGITLAYLQAPPILVAAFIAGLSMAVIFMCINLWWKISLHTAFVAGSATVLVMLYGWIAAVTVALVPLTAWSRVELKHHSLAQATTGAILAALIVAVVFSLVPF